MNPARAFWILRPKSKDSWLWFGFFALLFFLYFRRILSTPKGLFVFAAFLPPIALLCFVPSAALNFWETRHFRLRGVILAVPAYAAIVTLGHFNELYTFADWFNFVTLSHGAPFSSVHFVALLAGAAAYSTQRYVPETEIPSDEERVTDGPVLLSFEQAKVAFAAEVSRNDDEPKIHWGGIERPISHGTQNFCVIGAQGSGKTKSIQLLMQSVLKHVRPVTNRRALVYDVKRDNYAMLRAMEIPEERIIPLNPFDIRGGRWDLAADVTDSETAGELGTLLVPDKGEVQPFFPEAARRILGAAMDAFNTIAEGRWTLRDVVLTLQSEARLKIILKESRHLYYLVEKFCTENDTYKSIAATLENVMWRLSFVAASWEHSKIPFSVTEWMRSEKIILLGSEQLNAALVYRITQEILDQLEADRISPSPQTWIFIDELRLAGKITDFGRFIMGGRTKGACVVLGFQDYPGLIELYQSKEIAEELIGACGNRAFLKIRERKTSEMASEELGMQTVEIRRFSPSWSQTISESLGNRSVSITNGISVSTNLDRRPAVSPYTLRAIPWPNPRRGLHGYYVDASLPDPYAATIPGTVISKLPEPKPGIPDFLERPREQRKLEAWDKDDLSRLGLAVHAAQLLAEPSEGDKKVRKKGLLQSLEPV